MAAAGGGAMKTAVALLLGPCREAMSGVSTHLNLLFASQLAQEFRLVHFQVGREGRDERALGRLLRLAASPVLLAATIMLRRVAIVHMNTSSDMRGYWRDLVYMVVAKMCGTRIVYQVHGGALPQQLFHRHGALTGFLRLTLRLPDVIVVLARVELDAYRAFVPRQHVIALPNSVDCAAFAGLPPRRPDPGTALRLVYIGRLTREKGLHELLRALALVRERGVDARLTIAGSGAEEGRLREAADRLGLASRVEFAGPAFGRRKIELLAGSDASVLASYSEGLPYALLESMAAGVPVIASRVGAIPDVVVDRIHGLLIPPRDPQALAEAILELASDRERLARMGAACRERIAVSYSIDGLAQKFCRLYEGLRVANRQQVPTGS
jgi:glycosyltransferase involved in cell wall biosynthesis